MTESNLPADLAEIQARADEYARVLAQPGRYPFRSADERQIVMRTAADVPALVAELAERRATPQLTAEEARAALDFTWYIKQRSILSPIERQAEAKLRAIVEQATS
jgi:hypothetical protein